MLTGAAFNLLVTEEDKINLRRIEQHFNKTIPEVVCLIYCIGCNVSLNCTYLLHGHYLFKLVGESM